MLDHTLAGPELTNALRRAPLVDERHVASYTLGALDALLGYVAAEANHSTDKKIRRELDALYDRLRREMESYDDGMWQEASGLPGPAPEASRREDSHLPGYPGRRTQTGDRALRRPQGLDGDARGLDPGEARTLVDPGGRGQRLPCR